MADEVGEKRQKYQQREKLRRGPAQSFWHAQCQFPVHWGCTHNCKLVVFKIVLGDLFAFRA